MNHSRNLQHLFQIHITGQACFKTFRKLISLLHVHVQQSNKAPAPIIEDMETESLVGPKPTLAINPNQLSPGQKCPGVNFFFNALFVSEHFKHFEIYLFLTHFGG